MQDATLHSSPTGILWVLVADAGQARLYLCQKTVHKIPLSGANKHHLYSEKNDHELVPIEQGYITAESTNDYQIGHDRRGTSSSSNSPTHNTYEPKGDINKELQRRFIQVVADKIEKSSEENSFHHLVLVAPARILGELKTLWSATVNAKVIASLPKDLAQIHPEALMMHLRPVLVDAHSA